MKIKVIMSDKAMSRETMDARERMLKAALSSDAEVSVDCIKKGPDELDCNTDEAFAAGNGEGEYPCGKRRIRCHCDLLFQRCGD